MREKRERRGQRGNGRNGRRRALTAVLLAVVMALSMSSVSVHADILEDIKTGENAMAAVAMFNPNCRMVEQLTDLSVCISSEEAGVEVTIPVEKVAGGDGYMYMWMGAPAQRIEDAVMKKLAEIQGDIDISDPDEIMEELEALLGGFQVQVKGLPADHYVSEGGALVITGQMYRQAIEILRQSLAEEGIEFDSFAELIQHALDDMGLTLDDIFDTSEMTEEDWAELAKVGITEETFAQMKELIVNIDLVVDYFCSEAFTGILIADVSLECDCPYIWDYQIQHRYYERQNGKLKLAGVVHEGEYNPEWEEYCLYAEDGTVIRGSDYKKTAYKGKTYQYAGSYDDTVLYDDFRWKDYKQDSFILGDEENFTGGLVLRYIRDTDGSGTSGNGGQSGAGSQDGTDGRGGQSGQNGSADGAATSGGQNGQSPSQSGQDTVNPVPGPLTGDPAEMLVYLLILGAAIAVISVMTAYHKKQ